MKAQEAFDKVWDWFVNQKNGKSVRGGECKYRGCGGTKCALGVLLPDEVYSPMMESYGPSTVAAYLDWQGNPNFLYSLRYAHDSAAGDDKGMHSLFLTKITNKLQAVAIEYELKMPTVA